MGVKSDVTADVKCLRRCSCAPLLIWLRAIADLCYCLSCYKLLQVSLLLNVLIPNLNKTPNSGHCLSKGVFKCHYTFWMQGCAVSRSVHPRRSRGPGPGSIQRRPGHTGGICWVQPGPTLRLNPRRAVAIIRHTPHSSSEKVNTLIRFRMWHEQGVTIVQVHFTVDVLFAVKKSFLCHLFSVSSNDVTHFKCKAFTRFVTKISQREEFLQIWLKGSALTGRKSKRFPTKPSNK